ncbi:hypothetical protein ACKFKG_20030 [Phormidesmis sp. 146-35]
MNVLQELGILDTIKNACYLFLGLITGHIFWELCEHYCERAISYVNPLLFILTLCWGASGFFFLPPIFLPADQFLQYAFPDWDIPLSLLLKSHFLQHRSWLFSSTLIPLAFLSIIILQSILTQKTLQKRRFLIFLLNSLRDICVGFSVGITAHLIGDLIFQWIPARDTGIAIAGWQNLYSYTWFVLSLLFGFSIPLISIGKAKPN